MTRARREPRPPTSGVRALVSRPTEIVESTRWLFVVLCLASLLIFLPASLSTARGSTLAMALVSCAALCVSWYVGYARRSAPLVTDVVDAVAILGITLASPIPFAALTVVFPILWFRSLYGTARQAVVRCGIFAAAFVAASPLWTYVPGHEGGTGLVPLIGVVPTMLVTVIVGRFLAGTMQARQQATARDSVLVALGTELLGVTDGPAIRRAGWEAARGICAATPGLRVLKVVQEDGQLRVHGATGGFANLPLSIPIVQSSPGTPSDESTAGAGKAALDAVAGIPCTWASVPLDVPDQRGDAWLLLGSPDTVSAAALASMTNLAHQVLLALRNSEVHHELTVQATLDSLTGLANRATFNAAASRALADQRVQYTTVLFVDLDDFKDVNDAFGHASGDDLLREVAARLRRATRPTDVCARLGGDEFGVLLADTHAEAAAEVAHRIIRMVSAPTHLSAGVARVGASIGLATTFDDTDLEQLIHQADVAMYAAKAKGKARLQVFEPGLLQIDSARVSFERQLATAARDGELVLHYQPIISLIDGRCTAVEALVRWRHPGRGLLDPANFIEAAERSGAIVEIGSWVLHQACADATGWREAHPSSQVAIHVNVSALQLDHEGFLAEVASCLERFALSPECLVLEITESVVISSPETITSVNALAELGVTVAIDDFGTGFSALATLHAMPVGIVKIDSSLVAGSTVGAEDRAVTEAIVKMASQLGIRTIAEGVERLEQRAFLEEIGTDAVQGYLYHRPVPAAELGSWLATHLATLPRSRPESHVVVPFMPREASAGAKA